MPNTLAHFGVNGLLTKSAYRKADLVWIYIGCIIPDFPWIIRKIMDFVLPNVYGYELQAYAIVQATLFFSLLLSLTLALISKNTLKTFLILGFGSLLHLLLDPVQIKWANGVHLFAPFNWHLIEYGFFWPESLGTYFLTVGGIIFFIVTWKELKNAEFPLVFTKRKILSFAILLTIYFSLPFLFQGNVFEANNHFVNTLKNYDQRTGKYIEMDRRNIKYDKLTNSYFIESFDHSYVRLDNVENLKSNRLSLQGKFINNNEIYVTAFHENWAFFRDGASYIGILLAVLAMIIVFRKKIRFLNNTS